MTTGGIVFGAFIGVMVALINEAYRRNLKKEIEEVKDEILDARLDLKRDYRWLLVAVVRVYKKDKELMEVLKREVPRINEEE
ncbi:MAG: hypothetical protein U0J38_00690 [Bacteroidales bacterium]|nr:hypothetical protein [Bacteroidales bacterium]